LRVFKTKWLGRFARRERITDASLLEAIERAERGIIDADLGGGLIKQRVARPGQGRSGGYRMIVVYRTKDRAVFLYGFAKSERENIEAADLEDLRLIAADFLAADDKGFERIIAQQDLQEITS
jgi:hypothetical protein